ncbi:MAG TPA: right-handed parallel beta-helix repeat-containing protein, partial [Chitinispirillaceae bacterium]|nr:right-handed parallel beta-helix repeat-containing protein [Chitinispirillaceae bacterium]
MNKTKTTLSIVLLLAVVLSSLDAATYLVGKGKDFTTLQDVAGRLKPGDIVLIDGDASYPSGVYIDRNGTEKDWITIRGVRSENGNRPVISGNSTYGINVSADFVTIEGLQISGLAKGIGVFGNNIKVRDCIINDCNHGLIGYGTGTGNVTVEYCEFYGNGVPTGGATQHQIYMATDEIAHPGATFRLQYCYLHDAVQGDNVKSRAERNEIYYNWMENAGSSGHGLGLFAPDPEDNEDVSIETAREDTDVVGNVIIQQRNSCARIGGDAPGYPTNGRYRFVNNTFILTGSRGDCIRT